MTISTTVMGVVLGLLVILAGMLAYRASHSVGNKFNLDEAFTDSSGKTSMGRIGIFVALSVSSWGFVYLTLEGKLTEWFMTAFLGAFVLNGGVSKWLDKGSKDANPG